jgi:hypothetical protein
MIFYGNIIINMVYFEAIIKQFLVLTENAHDVKHYSTSKGRRKEIRSSVKSVHVSLF